MNGKKVDKSPNKNFKLKKKYLISFIFLLFSLVFYSQEPPQVIIIQPVNGTFFDNDKITVDYFISGTTPKSAKILVDDIPVQLLTEEVKTGQNTVILNVPMRNCKISIIAQNEFGASVPAIVHLKRSEYIFKPTLYVLAIGISKYNNPNLHLQFAAKDAIDFSQAMLRQQGLLYEKVVLKLLVDAQAVAENIRSGLEWLQKETTQKDVAMLYMAGHGENNNVGDFLFMPVYADIDRLNATCISHREIKQTIDAVAGKMLVFMDACHSGNVLGNNQKRATMLSQAITELTNTDNGAVVFTSSTGRQFSLENPAWNNGAFTKALVEGLSGSADMLDRKTISVKSLDLYITNRVKELTNGQQAPTTIIPNSVPDFPIAIVAEQTTLVSETSNKVISSSTLTSEPEKSQFSTNVEMTIETKIQNTIKLTANGRKVYQNRKKLTKAEARELFMYNKANLYLYNNGISMNNWGNASLLAGGLLICVGSSIVNKGDDELIGTGLSCILYGGAFAITGFFLKPMSKKPIKKSVDMYNNRKINANLNMELKIGISGNGIGLALKF